MRRPSQITITSRRDVLVGAGSGALLLMLGQQAAAQDAKAPAAVPLFDQALDAILGEAKPLPGKITLEIPEIAENGNTVPYAIAIDSPMTPADHVRAIHVLSTANPLPQIATFGLTPLAGRAVVTSRMRLAKTQDVVVLAELSTRRFIIGRKTVKVTIGGCGS